MTGTLITNGSGGYYLEGFDSRYGGVHFLIDGRMIKVLDSICCAEKMDIQLPKKRNGLVIFAEKECALTFDIKEAYDNSEWGRIYSIREEGGKILVSFTKEGQYALGACIRAEGAVQFKEEWIKRGYMFDKSRGSCPSERYVYGTITSGKGKITIAVAQTEKEAIVLCDDIFKNTGKSVQKKEKKDADIMAKKGLHQLMVQTGGEEGIYAGLPWFFQFWARDELVSTKALILAGRGKEAKKIMLKYMKRIADDGRLPEMLFPLTERTTADSVGWLFKRIAENHGLFTAKEKKEIVKTLEESIAKMGKLYMREGLVYNNPRETWMDTAWENDDRGGYRVEIQALFLHMLRFAKKMTGKEVYGKLEKELREEVKKQFWNNGYLYDGKNDETIRPNVLIAAYVYPELLTKKEWIACFKKILPALWLEWGGLASIDKESPLFCARHTGEHPQSYHRGDSWFWINNLAALVLERTDKKEFAAYIEKIEEASSKEIREQGIIGSHAELSSAEELRSEGCPAQAWSCAMFVEMMHERKK